MGPREYPHRPGWKEAAVSKPNAERLVRVAARMQRRVLALYQTGFVGTADDAADRLGISPFSCRPRCTELIALGFLARLRVDRSKPGRSAWVLQLAPRPKPGAEPAPPGDDDGQPDERQEWFDYDPDC